MSDEHFDWWIERPSEIIIRGKDKCPKCGAEMNGNDFDYGGDDLSHGGPSILFKCEKCDEGYTREATFKITFGPLEQDF